MSKLNDAMEEYGMTINTKKTKVAVISKKGNEKVKIVISRDEIEQVKQFRYLGSVITEDRRYEQEIRTRIAMARAAFIDRKTLLEGKLQLVLKKKLIKALIWSITLYSAETWALRKADIQRLEAPEMWLWRNMLHIKWSDKITNKEVLQQAEAERSLVTKIKERQKKGIGHVSRSGN